jgi:hypothetical protein
VGTQPRNRRVAWLPPNSGRRRIARMSVVFQMRTADVENATAAGSWSPCRMTAAPIAMTAAATHESRNVRKSVNPFIARVDQARVDQARVDQARVDQARVDQAWVDQAGSTNFGRQILDGRGPIKRQIIDWHR